jgi:hypothetical protein
LAPAALLVVVPGEGVKGAQLIPSGAELISDVISEPADIRADHLLPPKLVVEVVYDGALQELPSGRVVARPVDGVLAGPEGRTASQDERLHSLRPQVAVGLRALEKSVVDVDVGLDQSAEMRAV